MPFRYGEKLPACSTVHGRKLDAEAWGGVAGVLVCVCYRDERRLLFL